MARPKPNPNLITYPVRIDATNRAIGYIICATERNSIDLAVAKHDAIVEFGLTAIEAAIVMEAIDDRGLNSKPTAANVRSTVDILDPAYDSLVDDEELNYQDVIDNSAAELACIETTQQQLMKVDAPSLPEFDGMTPEERKEFKKSEAARLKADRAKSK
jgi:hypothetical protein